jgi:hypothetical protein
MAMEYLVTACACGLDPASETMVVQAGLAVALATPFWFRGHIANAVRLVRRTGEAAVECADAAEDEAASD